MRVRPYLILLALLAVPAPSLSACGTATGHQPEPRAAEPSVQASEPTGQAPEPPAQERMTEARARALARQAAVAEGIEVDRYVFDGIEAEADGYWVMWVLPPPTPPGGHFGVFVSNEGETRVRQGE